MSYSFGIIPMEIALKIMRNKKYALLCKKFFKELYLSLHKNDRADLFIRAIKSKNEELIVFCTRISGLNTLYIDDIVKKFDEADMSHKWQYSTVKNCFDIMDGTDFFGVHFTDISEFITYYVRNAAVLTVAAGLPGDNIDTIKTMFSSNIFRKIDDAIKCSAIEGSVLGGNTKILTLLLTKFKYLPGYFTRGICAKIFFGETRLETEIIKILINEDRFNIGYNQMEWLVEYMDKKKLINCIPFLLKQKRMSPRELSQLIKQNIHNHINNDTCSMYYEYFISNTFHSTIYDRIIDINKEDDPNLSEKIVIFDEPFRPKRCSVNFDIYDLKSVICHNDFSSGKYNDNVVNFLKCDNVRKAVFGEPSIMKKLFSLKKFEIIDQMFADPLPKNIPESLVICSMNNSKHFILNELIGLSRNNINFREMIKMAIMCNNLYAVKLLVEKKRDNITESCLIYAKWYNRPKIFSYLLSVCKKSRTNLFNKYVNMQIDNIKLLPKTIVVNSKISKIDGFGKNILEKLQENPRNIYIGGTDGIGVLFKQQEIVKKSWEYLIECTYCYLPYRNMLLMVAEANKSFKDALLSLHGKVLVCDCPNEKVHGFILAKVIDELWADNNFGVY